MNYITCKLWGSHDNNYCLIINLIDLIQLASTRFPGFMHLHVLPAGPLVAVVVVVLENKVGVGRLLVL